MNRILQLSIRTFVVAVLAALSCAMSANATDVWILGNVGNQDWNPNVGTQMNYVGNDTYVYEGQFNATSYISFTTMLGDWDTINPYRFGAEFNDFSIESLLGEYIACGALGESANNAFLITVAGYYKITLVMKQNSRKVMFERPTVAVVDGLCYRLFPSSKTATVVSHSSYSSLSDVVIPASLAHEGKTYTVDGIDQGAFNGCNLQSVAIYADIADCNGGFGGCTVGTLYVADNVTVLKGLGINASAIYCFGNAPAECDDATFATYNAALHVPMAAMTQYFMADVWNHFNNITGDAGQQPKELTLVPAEAAIELGGTLQLTATVTPTTIVPLCWSVSQPGVVTVSDDGLVSALAIGEVDVTASCMGLSQTSHITVQSPLVTAMLTYHELSLERGATESFQYFTTPSNKPVTLRSTDTAVATVTENNGFAVVTAVAPGEALIIATPEGDNVKPDTCRVTVTEITVSVTLNQRELALKRGGTAYLRSYTSPIAAEVIYSSTDADVALVRVVDGKAMVLGNRPGEALIIATIASEWVRPDTCRVTVIRPLGDVTADGLIDVEDVNSVINVILGKEELPVGDNFGYYDMNGDGLIDVLDVNSLINTLLNPEPLNPPTPPAPQTRTYTVGGVTFKMVAVEGGTFMMGATAEQGNEALSSEKPAHQVTLNGFAIGETEVTQALWQAVMGSNPSKFTGNNQRPVERVSWNDCQEFIAKLNELTGATFRLPTEAEWEYAARGGNKSMGYKYAGSNTLGDVAWYWDNIPSQTEGTAGCSTQTVATKAPNELGLYDMSGNVDEWCQDWHGAYSSGAQTNPTGPETGTGRVYRGGNWDYAASSCRVSRRNIYNPSYENYYLGLRLVVQ